MTIEIIILANSIKHQACCVAGKTIAGEWVRIVADSSGKELTKEQASITNPYGTFLVKTTAKSTVKSYETRPTFKSTRKLYQ